MLQYIAFAIYRDTKRSSLIEREHVKFSWKFLREVLQWQSMCDSKELWGESPQTFWNLEFTPDFTNTFWPPELDCTAKTMGWDWVRSPSALLLEFHVVCFLGSRRWSAVLIQPSRLCQASNKSPLLLFSKEWFWHLCWSQLKRNIFVGHNWKEKASLHNIYFALRICLSSTICIISSWRQGLLPPARMNCVNYVSLSDYHHEKSHQYNLW